MPFFFFFFRGKTVYGFASGFSFFLPTSCVLLMACGINPIFKMLKKTEFPGHLVLLCVHACLHPFTVRDVALQLQGE